MNYRNDSALIDRVADTTAHRDREALDESGTRLLLDCLDANSITLYHLIDHKAQPRVARRLELVRGASKIVIDRPVDLADLPAVSADPAWSACLERREVVHLAQCGEPSRCLFPIEDERQVIGMLEIIGSTPMKPRDVALVRGILRILRNQHDLLDYGERDTLTGLSNRKTFETRFRKLGHGSPTARDHSSDPSRASWLGLLDIDHFKSINDRFGHLFGDEVLLLVSQIMKRTFRDRDHVFRFGGEEFVVVLEHVDEVGAHTAFERLRLAVEAHRFPQDGLVTISLGYTKINPEDVPTTCVERADAALYYAKRNGRNNTRCHEALVATGELTQTRPDGDIELFS